jgi:hypothetical protein
MIEYKRQNSPILVGLFYFSIQLCNILLFINLKENSVPFVSRLFIKTGMIFFALALVTGLLLELGVGMVAQLRFVFWHMIMLGWITQIIMGVSLWMFPGRTKSEAISKNINAYLAYFGLNAGLILRVIAEPQSAYYPADVFSMMILVSAVLQAFGVVFYIREMWPRLSDKRRLAALKRSTS